MKLRIGGDNPKLNMILNDLEIALENQK